MMCVRGAHAPSCCRDVPRWSRAPRAAGPALLVAAWYEEQRHARFRICVARGQRRENAHRSSSVGAPCRVTRAHSGCSRPRAEWRAETDIDRTTAKKNRCLSESTLARRPSRARSALQKPRAIAAAATFLRAPLSQPPPQTQPRAMAAAQTTPSASRLSTRRAPEALEPTSSRGQAGLENRLGRPRHARFFPTSRLPPRSSSNNAARFDFVALHLVHDARPRRSCMIGAARSPKGALCVRSRCCKRRATKPIE